MIKIRRVYEPPATPEGRMILVDRLWPRGMSKAKLASAIWMKEVAPSEALRKEFHHDPSKWTDFRKRYLEELKHNREGVQKIVDMAGRGDIVLLYSAHDEEHNNAKVLKEYLEGLLTVGASGRRA